MTTPTTVVALAQYVPLIVQGIKDGADLISRIQAGDLTAEEAAKDWLGITGEVEDAIEAWKASEGDQAETDSSV